MLGKHCTVRQFSENKTMKIFDNRAGILACLGGFLLSLALSLDYSYPNLNTYVTSYLRTNG